MGLVATVLAVISIASFFIWHARNEAVAQRDIAVDAKEKEATAKKDAVEQRDVAKAAQVQEAVARQDAVKQRDAAEEAQKQEAAAREVAQQEEAKAVAAKQAEEYEAYVARIGLAAAKINDNAFDFAADLLAQSVPTAANQRDLRNWEWGRLKHLTELSASCVRGGRAGGRRRLFAGRQERGKRRSRRQSDRP